MCATIERAGVIAYSACRTSPSGTFIHPIPSPQFPSRRIEKVTKKATKESSQAGVVRMLNVDAYPAIIQNTY